MLIVPYDDSKSTHRVILELQFKENVVQLDYFGIKDVVSELGGIGASLKMVMSIIGIIFIFQYVWGLAELFLRKY